MAAVPTTSITAPPPLDLRVRDLGRMNYADALTLQRELQQEVIASRTASDGITGLVHLLLVEHDPPVITISRRPGARQHLLATDAMLLAAGVEVTETDRGGDITYHGPGQLVVYPILDLNRFGLRIDSYMRLLEQIVIDMLAQFDIAGERDPGVTGVWVRGTSQQVDESTSPQTTATKICALGVRVSRWVTMHGLALNVDPNLDHFNFIVPCGLAGRSVTSMRQALGEHCLSMDDVKRAMVERFERSLSALAATCGRRSG